MSCNGNATYIPSKLSHWTVDLHRHTHIRLSAIVSSIAALSFWAADFAADYCDAQMNLLTLPAPGRKK